MTVVVPYPTVLFAFSLVFHVIVAVVQSIPVTDILYVTRGILPIIATAPEIQSPDRTCQENRYHQKTAADDDKNKRFFFSGHFLFLTVPPTMIAVTAMAIIPSTAGREAFVGVALVEVEDETMTAQTLKWFVVVVSVMSCVFTCVGRMTHCSCAASKYG